MRIFILVFIAIIFGIVGYEIKRKYIEQKNMIQFMKSFVEFLHINISVYKNDIQEIINNYIIQQNNKNAKYVNVFQKNNNFSAINVKILEKYILKEDLKYIIISYFQNLGMADIDCECEKSKKLLMKLDGFLTEANDDIKLKGDLYFKLTLAIGVAFIVVLW